LFRKTNETTTIKQQKIAIKFETNTLRGFILDDHRKSVLTSGCSASVSTVHALLFDISDQMEGPTLMSSFIVVLPTRTRNKMALFPGLVTLYMLLLHLYPGLYITPGYDILHGVETFQREQSQML
jgi:hypothetical protein